MAISCSRKLVSYIVENGKTADPMVGDRTSILMADTMKVHLLTVSLMVRVDSSCRTGTFTKVKSNLEEQMVMDTFKPQQENIEELLRIIWDMVVVFKILRSWCLREFFNMVKENKESWNTTMGIFMKETSKTIYMTVREHWPHHKVFTQVVSETVYRTVMGSSDGKMDRSIGVIIIMDKDKEMESFTMQKIQV